jgi:hypothetical protein
LLLFGVKSSDLTAIKGENRKTISSIYYLLLEDYYCCHARTGCNQEIEHEINLENYVLFRNPGNQADQEKAPAYRRLYDTVVVIVGG